MIPTKLRFLTLFFLLGQLAIAQVYHNPKLINLRAECDSLSCPERYAEAYRLLAEDLYIPLETRLQYLDVAENISKNLANNYDLLTIYAQRGRINLDKGRYIESLAAFKEGIPYTGSRDDRKWLEQEGWFLAGYGILLYRVELYQDAQNVFRQCANVMHSIDDLYGEAVALNNVGLCLLNLEDSDSALHYFEKAYKVRAIHGDDLLLCHSSLYIARVYRLQEKWAKADSALHAAQLHSKSSKSFEFIGDIYAEWAEIALADSNYAEATYHLNRAKEMESPFRDIRWLRLKIRLFSELNIADSLNIYLDSALRAAKVFRNLNLELELLNRKRNLLRRLGKHQEANQLAKEALEVSGKLIAAKDSILPDMMRVQREYTNNREKLLLLEKGNMEKEQIIASQRRNLFFTTLIVLVLLASFIIYYRISNRLRRLNRDVRILNERSRLAAEQMTAGVLALSEKGNLAFINQSAQEYFSLFNRKKLIEGENFLEQLKEDIKADWRSRINEVLKGNSFQDISSRLEAGRNYYHLISASAIKANGKKEGLVAVITDVTSSQEKSLELSKKTKQLEFSNQAKEKVISLLAHDLKEGVVSSLELAKLSLDSEGSEELRKHMKLITESLGRTKTLLFKTLDWVKHQHDGIELKRKSFYLNKLLADVLKEIDSSADNKGVELKNEVNPQTQVIADPNALRVVMRNLIGNAIKFVDKTNGKIQIRAQRSSDNQIELIIEDNGQGMSNKQISQLMDGQKLSSTPGTSGEQGTGIGLNLCQQLLFQMGSTLKVESTKGEGSLFYFSLDSPLEAEKQ